MLLAQEIKKHHGGGDAFNGSSWWFFDPTRHIWRTDKSGAHIHETIIATIWKVWGGRGQTKSVKDAMAQLVEDTNTIKFRKELISDC